MIELVARREALNVIDRRHGWIGSWEVEDSPLVLIDLKPTDIGRTVIYRDHGRAEAGTLTSWNGLYVFARFHRGETAAACSPEDLTFAVRNLVELWRPPGRNTTSGPPAEYYL
jgi:hypothetical protein